MYDLRNYNTDEVFSVHDVIHENYNISGEGTEAYVVVSLHFTRTGHIF